VKNVVNLGRQSTKTGATRDGGLASQVQKRDYYEVSRKQAEKIADFLTKRGDKTSALAGMAKKGKPQ